MKFKFCGDTKIPALRMKMLSIQVMNKLAGGDVDYAKVTKFLNDCGLSISEKKGAIAVIEYILSNGAKYDVASETLSKELQQLGLPKENGDSMTKTFNDHKDRVQAYQKNLYLKLPKLTDVSYNVNYIVSSSELSEVGEPEINLNLKLNSTLTSHKPVNAELSLTREQLDLLITELKKSRDVMKSLADE
eukprot:CAMPEP_0114995278 /NCGR_PEP_ID=MMETSP0216-20121206/13636_1 /TAXON_ID=223996 /ORGANISM="Protocruzia adherens, Strain Boccale" /LENGTH=188 /DNA_ID=CAMNT_0002359293 /DNA_START=29 /DNA_END=595 /DNA_ORIENTATION=+